MATVFNTFKNQIYLNLDEDVGLNNNGSLIIGTKTSDNLAFDANEIMARKNGAVSTLYLNNEGGLVQIGSGGLNVTYLRTIPHVGENADDKRIKGARIYFNSTPSGGTATYPNHQGWVGVSESGQYYGLYSVTKSKYLVNMDTSNGNVTLNGNASTATALTSNAGSSTLPVYFSGGKPVVISNISLGSSTDTNDHYVQVWSKDTGLISLFANSSNDTRGLYVKNSAGAEKTIIQVSNDNNATFTGTLTGNASTATALTSNAGSSTLPVYFSGGKPVAISNLSITKTGTSDKYTEVGNDNGTVRLLTSANRGVYDNTSGYTGWIIYRKKSAATTYIPEWASIGSSTKPIYMSSSGRPVELSFTASQAIVSNSSGGLTTQDLTTDDVTSSGGTNNLTFISKVTQSATGKITAIRNPVRAATDSQSGIITTEAQTIAGAKTFNNSLVTKGNLTAGTTTTTATRSIIVTTDQGSLSMYGHGSSSSDQNFGLYMSRSSGNKTLMYIDASNIVYIPQWANIGNTNTNPINMDSSGRPKAISFTASRAIVSNANGGLASADLSVANPTSSAATDALVFVSSLSQNAQGKISITRNPVRSASGTQSGIITTGAQTIAGTKTFTGNINISNSDAKLTLDDTTRKSKIEFTYNGFQGVYYGVAGVTSYATAYINNKGGDITIGKNGYRTLVNSDIKLAQFFYLKSGKTYGTSFPSASSFPDEEIPVGTIFFLKI